MFIVLTEVKNQAKTSEIPLLTGLLTPWSTVLLEKLRGYQLVKKFPALYGTRRFITAVTIARHLSLS
jgi:2-keto-3-deoxy-6-phosphogluconate aldolase